MSDRTITKDKFPVRVKHIKRKPWGYDKDGDAIPDQLEALSEAMDALDKGESLRSTTARLAEKGYTISPIGLSRQHKKYRPDSPVTLAREQRKNEKKKKIVLTKEERKKRDANKRLADARRSATWAKKEIARLTGKVENANERIKEEQELTSAPIIYREVDERELTDFNREVLFRPNKGPQTEFINASEREVLFGGAAGGGKSYALLADPMRYFEQSDYIPRSSCENFNGLLVRRTNDELRELKWKSQLLYPKLFPGAKYNKQDSEWTFPSGAKLWFSYLESMEDLLRYQGQAFTWVGFDELTQWNSPEYWTYLGSRLRTTDPILRKYLSMRGTTNPGGPGHVWVKKYFIDPAPANKAFWATNLDGQPIVDPETGEYLYKRRFIPSRLEDNPYLAEDGEYRKQLLQLPELKRRQYLEGQWVAIEGIAFPEFTLDLHTCEPFHIPKEWSRFRAMDYGYSSASSVIWFAVDPDTAVIYVYRELYVSKHTGKTITPIIKELESGERMRYGILDSSTWNKRGEGPSEAEIMNNAGLRWRPSDRSAGSRVAGKDRIHDFLRYDDDTQSPGVVIFNTCRKLIEELQTVPEDPRMTGDVDRRVSQRYHSYDAFRYGLMSRPRPDAWVDDIPRIESFKPADLTFGY